MAERTIVEIRWERQYGDRWADDFSPQLDALWAERVSWALKVMEHQDQLPSGTAKREMFVWLLAGIEGALLTVLPAEDVARVTVRYRADGFYEIIVHEHHSSLRLLQVGARAVWECEGCPAQSGGPAFDPAMVAEQCNAREPDTFGPHEASVCISLFLATFDVESTSSSQD